MKQAKKGVLDSHKGLYVMPLMSSGPPEMEMAVPQRTATGCHLYWESHYPCDSTLQSTVQGETSTSDGYSVARMGARRPPNDTFSVMTSGTTTRLCHDSRKAAKSNQQQANCWAPGNPYL